MHMELSRDFIGVNQTLLGSKQHKALMADLGPGGMLMLIDLWMGMFRNQVNINSLSNAEIREMATSKNCIPPVDFLNRLENAGFIHKTESGRLRWRPAFVKGINALPERRGR